MKIRIDFIGGHKEGCRVVGDTDHGPSYSEAEKEAFDAISFYHMTNDGRLGAASRGITGSGVNLMQTIGVEAAVQQGHKFRAEMYVVTERIEANGEVLVRATFVPDPVGSLKNRRMPNA